MPDSSTPNKANADLAERLRMTGSLFLKDLNSMPDEILFAQNGGKSRRACDLAYEVTFVNLTAAQAARGETLPAAPDEAWMTLPNAQCDRSTLISEYQRSLEEAAEAIETLPDERAGTIVPSPLGDIPLIRLMHILPGHQMYHSGQLNYIQTLHGDDAFHWS